VSSERLHSDVSDATTEPSPAAEHHFNPGRILGRDWPDKSASVYQLSARPRAQGASDSQPGLHYPSPVRGHKRRWPCICQFHTSPKARVPASFDRRERVVRDTDHFGLISEWAKTQPLTRKGSRGWLEFGLGVWTI